MCVELLPLVNGVTAVVKVNRVVRRRCVFVCVCVCRSCCRGSVVTMYGISNRRRTHRPQCFERNSSRAQPSNGFYGRERGRHCQSCRCVTGNTTDTVVAADAFPQVTCVKRYNLSRCGKLPQYPKVSGKESMQT